MRRVRTLRNHGELSARRLGWKVFLPLSIAAVVLIAGWREFGPAV